MIGMAHVLVVYRVLAAALFNSALPFLEEQVTTAVVVTGALVHYVTILVMTKVGRAGGAGRGAGLAELRAEPLSPRPQINKCVALKLCDFGELSPSLASGGRIQRGGLRALGWGKGPPKRPEAPS